VRSLRLEQAANLKAFLMRPVPQEAGTLLCSIRRNKSTFRKMFPTYRLYMKMPDGADLFLMVSKKRSGQKTSNYLISMSEDDLARKSPNYLGKLRANFVGTEFRVYDNGSNPDDIDNDDEDEKGASSEARQELGVVLYESNVMGARGPRKMQVSYALVFLPPRSCLCLYFTCLLFVSFSTFLLDLHTASVTKEYEKDKPFFYKKKLTLRDAFPPRHFRRWACRAWRSRATGCRSSSPARAARTR
jgi:hypothetical protein